MSVKVSIIIPVYNTLPELLDKAVQSCLKQTLDDIEIIIVDDGSSNQRTMEYLSDLESKKSCDADRVIRVIRSANGGVMHARMLGAMSAEGSFITFLDSDDLLNTDFCRRLYEVIVSGEDAGYRTDMVSCNSRTFKSCADIETEEKVQPGPEIPYEQSENLVGGSVGATEVPTFYTIWGKLFKKSIFTKACEVDPKIKRGEDLLAVAKYLSESERVVTIEDCLYYYNAANDDSVTRQADSRQMTVALAWCGIYDLCLDKGYEKLIEPAAKKAIVSLIDVIAGAGHNKGADNIGEYSRMMRRFKKYLHLLNFSQRLRAEIIIHAPWMYVVIAESRQKREHSDSK